MATTPTPAEAAAALRGEVKRQAAFVLGPIAVLWIVHFVNAVLLGNALLLHGIHPRTVEGLLGILYAPFLHAGLGHLVANTATLLVLGWLVTLRESWHVLAVAAAGIVVGGLGTWLCGSSDSVHVGASGIAFAFLGHLLLIGWLEKRVLTVVGSLVVALCYGGMVFGVLPGQEGISWEGHLFGFLGGLLSARLLARRTAAR